MQSSGSNPSSLMEELQNEEAQRLQAKSNVLKCNGNRSTMNLNPLILTNIQNSPYYKNNVTPLESFEEVVDEIFHRVCLNSLLLSVLSLIPSNFWLSLNIYRSIILSLGNVGLVSQWPEEFLVEALYAYLILHPI